MTKGWNCKQGAVILHYSSPSQFSKGYRPAVTKIATLALANFHMTMHDILEEMDKIKAERQAMKGRPGLRYPLAG